MISPLATADDVRRVDGAELRPTVATVRRVIQRLTDRLIAGMF
jgi:hypothetical protein